MACKAIAHQSSQDIAIASHSVKTMIKRSTEPTTTTNPGRWQLPDEANWDVVVVGAGPAGSLAARELARRGARVLLVDKAAFPRHKVCGCCLNGAALAALDSSGLGSLPARLGAVPLSRFKLCAIGARAALDFSLGVSISREAFDTALVEEAVRAGACFAPLTCALVRAAGGPGQLAAQILAQVGLPAPALLAEALWHATPALTTSRAHVAAERVFVLGDAAGYIEPFTGEGMAWAVRSAAAVAPLALSAVCGWRPELAGQWESAQRQIVGHRQRVCRTLSGLLRSPALAALGASVLSRAPWLAAPLVRSLNAGERIGPRHAAPCSPPPQGVLPQPAMPFGHASPTSHHA